MNSYATTAANWLRPVRSCPGARARIVCFPHVGGTASFFRSWAEFAPRDVEILAVRYPGREDRLLEPPATSMAGLADPIAAECLALADRPLVLFGHSMGAAVAHEVARRLEARHRAARLTLVVSSHPGPGQELPGPRRSKAPDAELIKEIGLLGGTQAEALAHPELRELVLPTVRADYHLIEEHAATAAGPALTVPIVAYHGTEDADLTEGAISTWAAATHAPFVMRSFDGGHFYLAERPREVLADIFARVPLPDALPAPQRSHDDESV